jgi:hypothetical protein
MGTRSAIAVTHGDNIKAIYCHNDGYLSHNGDILENYYDSVQANNLVALGDISSLGTDIGDTVFYGRDRGEENCEFETFSSEKEYISEMNHMGCEYYYLMRDGVWYVSTGKEFTLLSKKLMLESTDQE